MAEKKSTKAKASTKAAPKAAPKAKAQVEEAAPKAAPRKPDKPYDLKQWGSHTLYQCKLCPFNSLHEQVLLTHIINRHAPQPQPTGLVGPDGKPLVKED